MANGSCLGAAPMETEMIFSKVIFPPFFSIQLCARRMLQSTDMQEVPCLRERCHWNIQADNYVEEGGRKHGFHLSAGTHVISADATSTVYLLGTPLLQIRKTT